MEVNRRVPTTGPCGEYGVCIYGRRITELLCQTKVDEEGDRAINEYHEVCWLDVTMDLVLSM